MYKRQDLDTAIRDAKALSQYDLFWYEEAGDPLDFELQATLRNYYDKPMACLLYPSHGIDDDLALQAEGADAKRRDAHVKLLGKLLECTQCARPILAE